MQNKFSHTGDGTTILYCPRMPAAIGQTDSELEKLLEVFIDEETFIAINGINALWEECKNPFEEDEQKVTIGAIIHKQFVDLKRVVAGVQKIPVDDSNVITDIVMEEYIGYLNSHSMVYTGAEKGFVYPLTHVLAKTAWNEGVLHINGNSMDNRSINLLTVTIKDLQKHIGLALIEGDQVVYKAKR